MVKQVYKTITRKESSMLMYALFFLSGLVIGWNFFPQPDWVKELVNKLFGKKGDENV